jgi:hypothetical protein
MFQTFRKLRRLAGLPAVDLHFLASIDSVPWFSRCGAATDFDIPVLAQSVGSWDEAMEACKSEESAEAFHEARNALSSYLHVHHNRRFQSWNEIVVEAKQRCIGPLERSVWQPFARERSLDEIFVHRVRWNVLGAVIEHEYQDCQGAPVFAMHLLNVFRHGHFPCGWLGAWPTGNLLYL